MSETYKFLYRRKTSQGIQSEWYMVARRPVMNELCSAYIKAEITDKGLQPIDVRLENQEKEEAQ